MLYLMNPHDFKIKKDFEENKRIIRANRIPIHNNKSVFCYEFVALANEKLEATLFGDSMICIRLKLTVTENESNYMILETKLKWETFDQDDNLFVMITQTSNSCRIFFCKRYK